MVRALGWNPKGLGFKWGLGPSYGLGLWLACAHVFCMAQCKTRQGSCPARYPNPMSQWRVLENVKIHSTVRRSNPGPLIRRSGALPLYHDDMSTSTKNGVNILCRPGRGSNPGPLPLHPLPTNWAIGTAGPVHENLVICCSVVSGELFIVDEGLIHIWGTFK